jgi:type IV pilus assembly protein PilC
MFGSRLSLKQLSTVCRSLGTTLHAGVPILKAIDIAGGKASQPALRKALQEVSAEIRSGSQVSTALEDHGDVFPELVVDMTRVAEQTGMMPEVFRSLADHYDNLQRQRNEFISQITWPVIQFLAALFIIAGMIFLLGLVSSGASTIDPLGFGLHGERGAAIWLGGWAMLIAAGFVLFKVVTSSPAGQKTLYGTLMRTPVVGKCLEAFAISRFSWAFHLTQEAGMPIDDSLRASLKATSNGAFIAATDNMVRAVEEGDSLTDALAQSDLFSEDFVQMVHVGETTGTVPETLNRLSPQFEDQARRSLRTLATAAGWLVWCMVAGFIIFIIFRIAFWYVGLINDAVRMTQ